MIFGRVPLAQARGGILAHNLKVADRVIRKGALVDATVYALLSRAGYAEVTIARLESGDVPEGQAANRLGQALLGPGLYRSGDVHGRVNLFADGNGMLRLSAEKIERLNAVDEAITLATLLDRSVVKAGDMIATLKIIPFAVPGTAMAEAEAMIRQGTPTLSVKPFQNLVVGLILTTLPQLKKAAITHTIAATEARISAHGGTMLPPLQTDHAIPPLRLAILALQAQAADLILVSGASAVTDRLDIAPQAIVAAGGNINHFGMPVDPGNLICFGTLGSRPIIVLPGCARSPKLNGIDWILDRIFAGEEVGAREIARMGVGGLLKEMAARPVPRLAKDALGFGTAPRALPKIAALILAAGRSTRLAPDNKLLAKLTDGKKMIEQTVDHAVSSSATDVLVVTGHQDSAIRQALAGKPVRFIHADGYKSGIAASLRAGIAALSDDVDAALICLGDMPLVEPSVMNSLIAFYDPTEGREIVLPVFDGQRGNPVLWGRRFFPKLLDLAGDTGGRQILRDYMESVVEIPVETDSVLMDFDTPEALAALAAK
jgi:molybdenum cofactor cytidylyltransferase